MATQQSPDPEMFTKKFQFTPTFYHDLYPSIDPTNPDLSQSGRVILITGAGRGIGQAVALYFAKAGAKGLVICSRTDAELEETRAEVGKIDPEVEVVAVKADVSVEEDVLRVFQRAEDAGLKIDVLVSNAGPTAGTDKLAEKDSDKWWYQFEVHTKGLYLFSKYFIQQLEGRVGTLVYVSAFVTLIPVIGRSDFSSAKAACNHIIEHIHEEEPNVRAFSVHPGVVPTSASSAKFAFLAKDSPALPAGVIGFLTTPRAEFLRGRWVSANWSVDDLDARRTEIVKRGLLKTGLKAQFGPGGHPFD